MSDIYEMKSYIQILAVLLLSSCAHVRQDDLDSWKGAPVIDLESHPIFSTMEVEKRELSDGSTLLNLRNKGTFTSKRICTGSATRTGNYISGGTECSGGGTHDIECINQFLVKNGVVQEYRAIGQCYTNCLARPRSNPCREPASK